MGLDYGSKTVGVAVTDGLGLTAVSLEIIRRERENQLRPTFRRIEELVKEYDVHRIVLGLPLNMDGTESGRSELARSFGRDLEKRMGIPVVMQDERLTTVEADEIIELTGQHKKNRKDHIDSMAAAIILTDYLNQNME
ncbi:MAG: Holliday junction resolvase RuvX [Lachnospiraceae bacterium]|nr:Holliday junction resolvase RuvX [Lachnospiraceae bacterium]MBR1913457.1 Holliday junction resolvase RuvX [Lachnospiraceae bacterium]